MTMSEPPSLKPIGAVRRKSVSVSSTELVKSRELAAGRPLPLLFEPGIEGIELASWAAGQREPLERLLLAHGGLLFRGFAVGLEELDRFMRALSDDLLDYTYRSTPRSQVTGKIYSSTEYPADQAIPFHNEMSYSRSWPLRIWFCCLAAAATGGATPIADSRRVYQRMPGEIREEFERKKVMYVRNYGAGVDLPWQEVFQTDSRDAVESFCADAGIEVEWHGGDRLRTRQVCQATAVHPQTGDKVWFNQAHLFHVSSLQPDVQRALLDAFGEEGLSRNTYYGDGSPIDTETLDEIRRVYAAETVSFPWQPGDLLMLDNMLVAHAREPFTGARKVVVGMAQAVSQEL